MAIDLASLNKAIDRLEFALTRYAGNTSDEEVRDSVIQRFEFTYDLSHKMLRRVLEAAAADPSDVERMTFPALIRTAWEQGLVASSWEVWSEFRTMRNITSHTYDEAKALGVVGRIPAFLQEAKQLQSQLAQRIAA